MHVGLVWVMCDEDRMEVVSEVPYCPPEDHVRPSDQQVFQEDHHSEV